MGLLMLPDDFLRLVAPFISCLYRKVLHMPTSYTNTVVLYAPASQKLVMATALGTALEQPADDYTLRAGVGDTANGPIDGFIGIGSFTEVQLDAIRVTLSPGGTLHELGCRARRLLNEASEATVETPGKTLVTVIGVGQPIPASLDWATHRVTMERFLEELEKVRVQPAF
jgi:hypothetical protein